MIAGVPAYAGFVVVEIPWDVFRERWIPGLTRDRLLVGINWSGPRATGYEVEPVEVEARVTAEKARLGSEGSR